LSEVLPFLVLGALQSQTANSVSVGSRQSQCSRAMRSVGRINTRYKQQGSTNMGNAALGMLTS
jgi:hypothetical protein